MVTDLPTVEADTVILDTTVVETETPEAEAVELEVEVEMLLAGGNRPGILNHRTPAHPLHPPTLMTTKSPAGENEKRVSAGKKSKPSALRGDYARWKIVYDAANGTAGVELENPTNGPRRRTLIRTQAIVQPNVIIQLPRSLF